jgi:hypothetical protein
VRSAIALALALGGLPAALSSQPGSGEVPLGTRVRVSAPSLRVRAVGTLAPAGPDTIAVTPPRGGGGRMAFHRSVVTALEVSGGRGSPVLAGAKWALLGAPAGALAGASVGFVGAFTDTTVCDGEGTRQECERASDRAYGRRMSTGLVVGVVIGLVGGAGFGIGRRAERWRRADAPVRLGVAPRGVTVSVAFGRP